MLGYLSFVNDSIMSIKIFGLYCTLNTSYHNFALNHDFVLCDW